MLERHFGGTRHDVRTWGTTKKNNKTKTKKMTDESKVLKVADKYRTNPQSLEPGGSTIRVYFVDDSVRDYDKIKSADLYVERLRRTLEVDRYEVLAEDGSVERTVSFVLARRGGEALEARTSVLPSRTLLFRSTSDGQFVEVFDGDIVDIHQTVNGCNLFAFFREEGGFSANYFLDGKVDRAYEYSVPDLALVEELEVVGNVAVGLFKEKK